MITRIPTYLDFKVLTAWLRWGGDPDPSELSRPFREGDRSPATLDALWHEMVFAWAYLAPAFGLAWLGVWLVLHQFSLVGLETGVRVMIFGGVFALSGGVDAYWRYLLAWKANQRDRRSGMIDTKTRRMLRLVQLNNGRIFIQLAVATVFAIHN